MVIAFGIAATEASETLLRDVPETCPPLACCIQCLGLILIVQTDNDFEDGDDVEITAGRDEVVTLTYEDSSTVTISSDRSDVPAGGQVHITISDFQLNLDPTATDKWTLNNNGDKTLDIR